MTHSVWNSTRVSCSVLCILLHSLSSVHEPFRPTWGIASLHQTTDFYPQDTSRERACRQELAVWPPWHDDVAYTIDLSQHVIFRSEVGNESPLRTRCQQTIAVRLPVCVYLWCTGKQRLWLAAFTWGSDCIDLGAMSPAVFWREACSWHKLVFGMPIADDIVRLWADLREHSIDWNPPKSHRQHSMAEHPSETSLIHH
jgi:hypothetical protein